MEKRQISFSPPDITEAEVSAVADALRSGWITTGPRTKEFEKRIAKLCGTDKAVALGSATACLESILRFLGIGAGDEVITSAYTYTASASPAVHVGAALKFIDVAPDSFEMDYDALEAAITEKTKVIVPVDIAGVPCDYDRIFDIVERKKALFHPSNDVQRAIGRVIVAADSAHAFGASYMRAGERIMCGNVADFTSFSFHAVKNLTTAEGGALTWRTIEGFDDEYIYKHQRISEWTYAHFPDAEFGEWYGYLHRDGTVAQPAKGNLFKGPFHIPRMMIKAYSLCHEILNKE